MTPLVDQRLLAFEDVFPGKIPVCPRTGRRFISRGELAIVRVAGRVFIPEIELEAFLQRNFIPAREPARKSAPVNVEEILNRHAPRKRRAG